MKQDQARNTDIEEKGDTEVEDKVYYIFFKILFDKKIAAEFLVDREALAQSLLNSQVKDVD